MSDLLRTSDNKICPHCTSFNEITNDNCHLCNLPLDTSYTDVTESNTNRTLTRNRGTRRIGRGGRSRRSTPRLTNNIGLGITHGTDPGDYPYSSPLYNSPFDHEERLIFINPNSCKNFKEWLDKSGFSNKPRIKMYSPEFLYDIINNKGPEQFNSFLITELKLNPAEATKLSLLMGFYYGIVKHDKLIKIEEDKKIREKQDLEYKKALEADKKKKEDSEIEKALLKSIEDESIKLAEDNQIKIIHSSNAEIKKDLSIREQRLKFFEDKFKKQKIINDKK